MIGSGAQVSRIAGRPTPPPSPVSLALFPGFYEAATLDRGIMPGTG